ncbi:hypothetical protein [Candidatus Amarolinea aalborgensis]|uniref:hypothetical protein n=1 Tax=Candidatus Amarolinea aalborgensis TaxID=2249329 RepID=UPI003BF9C5D7
MKGVCCHDPLAFLIVPSLFRAPSCPAAGGASAAGRPSAGCLQPADLSGDCGYPHPQINTTTNRLSPAHGSNPIAAPLAATPTVGAPPCLGSDCTPTPTATPTATATRAAPPCLGSDCTPTPTATATDVSPTSTATWAQTPTPTVTPPPGGVDEVWVMPDQESRLHSRDGRVVLAIPAGAVSAPTLVRYVSHAAVPDQPTNLSFQFELIATELSGVEITQFLTPLTLNYRDPTAGDEGTPWPPGAALFYQDTADGRWVVLPTSVDQEQRELTTTLTHFTLFAAGNSIVPEPAPGIKGMQSQLYNGAWTVSYPIEAPPGPGGLAPGLSLEYSSRSLAGGGHHQLAGWGWDLGGLSYVLRDLSTGKYSLTLDGMTHELEEHGGYFYSVQDPFLKIRRPTASNPDYPVMEYFDPSTPANPFKTIDLPQTPGQYNRDNQVWEVTTEGGVTYHFEPMLYVRDCSGGDWTPSTEQRVVHRFTKWMLTEVRDTTPATANRVTFSYDYEGTLLAVNVPVCPNDYTSDARIQVRAARVKEISYGPGGIFKVQLAYLNREDRAEHFDETGYQVFWTRKYLQQVEVRANNTLLHKVGLGMTAFTNPAAPSQSRLYLSTITRYGADNSTLPPTTYTYGSGTTDGFMAAVDNGYHGRVEIAYISSNGGMVVQQERRRGGGSDPDIVTQYWYTTTWDSEAGGFAEAEMTLVGSGALIGSGQPDTRIRQWFHTTTNLRRWKGKLYKAETRAGSGVTNNLLARTLQTWNETNVGTPGGMTFVYLQDKTEYVVDPNGTDPPTRYTKTVYVYDPAYGNLRLSRLYSEAAPTTPYRTNERVYFPRNDATAYIVNQVAEEKLWEGSEAGICRGQSRYVYDNNSGYAAYNQAPTNGQLKEVWEAGQGGTACNTNWVRSAAYDYDAWGNRTKETAANGRTVTTVFDSTFHAYAMSVSIQPDSQLGGATLTTTYTRYGINAAAGGNGLVGQVQSETDANLAVTRYTYDTFGRLTEVRKPGAGFSNPATEQIVYTTDQGLYVQRHLLRDDGNGDASASATYLEERTFYDGLGRARQTQKEYDGSQWSLVSQRYDELGNQAAVSAPYTGTVSGVAYQAVNWNGLAATLSAYDRLGRIRQVTQPDGATVRTYYQNRQTAVIDAVNHQTISEYDAWGRLVSVKQYDLTLAAGATPNWGATVYGQASYSYDVADRLAQMTGADGAITAIGYDLLGRKTSMSDPDMGVWNYAYDAAGNLKRQADGRGQQICFYYDGHNRLAGKHYRSDANCPGAKPTTYGANALSVEYLYDGGANGKGRRTQADVYTAGGALDNRIAWTYDIRGRVTAETHTIDGAAYALGFTYDSADRPLSLSYPAQSAETVNLAYTAQGLPGRLYSSVDYVQSGNAVYDVAGRLTQLKLGKQSSNSDPVVQVGFSYYPWTTITGQGRLQQLTSGIPGNLSSLQNLTYAYDAVGNVDWIKDWKAGSPQMQDFTVDRLNRLVNAVASGGANGVYPTETYGFAPNGNLTTKTGVGAYSYGVQASSCPEGALSKPHAAVTAGSSSYCYDQNGNMRRRTVGGSTYTLTYDAESRLVSISGAATASFAYDADGNRIKSVLNGETITYVGSLYEKKVVGSTTTHTKYYTFGDRRIAVRVAGTLSWLLSDHLGSTAVTADGVSGARTAELWYKSWGESRGTPFGATPTTYRSRVNARMRASVSTSTTRDTMTARWGGSRRRIRLSPSRGIRRVSIGIAMRPIIP